MRIHSTRGQDDNAMATARQPETIGERIKRLRRERGLAQRHLAAPGVTYAYISRIESGARVPSVKAIRKIARALGVTAEYLETGADLHGDELLELRLVEAELGSHLGDVDDNELEAAAEQLVREADELGDRGLAARGRITGARVAASSGRFATAIEQLEGAIRTGSVSSVAQPQVFVLLAKCYRSVGRVQEAVETLRRALEEARGLPSDDLSRARLRGALSEILEQLGELEEARTLRATDATPRAPDRYSRIRALWTVARGPELDEWPRERLRRLREALYLLENTENTLEVARAHLDFARNTLFGEQPENAEAHLDAARLLLVHSSDPVARGSMLGLRALCEAHQGDLAAAEELAREAIELLSEHPAEQAPAWLAVGMAAGERGDVDTASAAFAAAVERLEAANLQQASRACRAWTGALRRAGRLEEALDVAERGAALAAQA
jgi:transcriptional regulator with XRE-family HTH domain